MKTKLLFTTIFAIIISVTTLSGQERHDYSIEFIGAPFDPVTNVSSTYWYGQNYTFWVWDEYEPQLWVNMNKMNDNGHVSSEGYTSIANIPENDTVMTSSCTYKQDLYIFFTCIPQSVHGLRISLRFRWTEK